MMGGVRNDLDALTASKLSSTTGKQKLFESEKKTGISNWFLISQRCPPLPRAALRHGLLPD